MKEKYVPIEIAMEGLDPVYKDEAQREKAENVPFLVEQGKRAAFAILRNGGAKNAAELEAVQAARKKGAAK